MTEDPRSAASRMAGLFGVFAGSAVILFIGTFPPRIAVAFHSFPWWTAWVVSTEVLCALALLAAGLRRNPRLQRRSAAALMATYCLSSVWMLAHRGLGHGSDVDVVWHEAYPSIVVIGLLPFLRRRTVLVLAVVLFTVVGLLAVGDPRRGVAINVLHMYALGWFSVAVSYSLLEIATVRDEQSARTRERITAAAVAEAEQIERERIDGLIHDSVMSTLLAAAGVGSAPRVAAAAGNALGDLDALRFPGDDQPVTIEDLIRSLRAGLHFVDPELTITTSVSRAPRGPLLPAVVARDLTAAATEALRNSVLHAYGHPRSASVSYREETAGTPGRPQVEIVVRDDGPGYDPRAVPTHRLGTRASIVGRMDGLPGCRASIDTAPGAGVRVELTWSPP